MAMTTSTSAATIEESRRIEACKEGVCIACYIWQHHDHAPAAFSPIYGCDYHHVKSGNVRRGHMFGFGLCLWHHRGHPPEGWTSRDARLWYGPGLMDGGKRFTSTYGSDDELIEVQNRILDASGGTMMMLTSA